MPAVFLQGPTAAGKSALALAIAARLPCEIVSVDSGQVYRGMDIGTAKPTAAERAAVPHHLIDICDPNEPYSAGQFRDDARRLIADIEARGRIALLVGGTFLYFRALERGIADLPTADAATRQAIEDEAAARGWAALHAELARIDPVVAARIAPADRQRIGRAIEVYRLTGRPLSAWQAEAEVDANPPALRLILAPADRQTLYAAVDARFTAMLRAGLLDEVAALREAGYARELPALRAVGYRQACAHLAGEIDYPALVETGRTASRQYAKRQLTWLRGDGHGEWLDPADARLVERAHALIDAALSAAG